MSIYNFSTKVLVSLLLLGFICMSSVANIRNDTIIDITQVDTALFCHADSIALDAGPGVTYDWNTGSIERIIYVKSTGNYSVEVYDGTSYNNYSCYFINARIENTPATFCYNKALTLTVTPVNLYYEWFNGDSAFYTDIVIKDTGSYFVKISTSMLHCYDTVTLDMYPRMNIEFDQKNEICKGLKNCNGQVQALVNGGLPPYSYNWYGEFIDPADSSWALGLCADSSVTYQFSSSDQYGCTFDTSIMLKYIDMPKVEINRTPDTIFLTNPEARFTFTNNSIDSIKVTDWSWKFGDGTKSDLAAPVHYYQSVGDYDLYFIYTTDDGCQDSIYMRVPVKELELKVPNVFTPNGDGVNDYFEIKKLEYFVSNEFIVFNRWGKKVYESSTYNNDWDGGGLSDGTYFYILKCVGYFKNEEFQGVITILGSDNK